MAFINLLSPLTADAKNTVAADTFEDRLAMVIRQLKAFDPDIVGFNEASWTRDHGSSISRLAKELRMEMQYARANPDFPGVTGKDADELVKKAGFEEGELILVRGSRYPVLKATQYVLNPKTTEAGERRVALHVVVKGPATLGAIDVYITHLTGGGDTTRKRQGADFAAFVAGSRGPGPAIAMVGQSDPGAASTYEFYATVGLRDVAGKDAITTCCRDSVIGEQPPPKARNDYLMSDRWKPISYQLFANEPEARADGTLVYASDHNGIAAVFPIPQEPSRP